MNTIATSPNQSGLVYGLVKLNNGNGLVYVKKTNYLQGRDVTRWILCNKPKQSHGEFQKMAKDGMDFNDAYSFYCKKLQGKQKH